MDKQGNHKLRKTITPHERFIATLRFLATGRSYEVVKFYFIINKSVDLALTNHGTTLHNGNVSERNSLS